MDLFESPGYNRYSFHTGHSKISNALDDIRSRLIPGGYIALPRGWKELVASLHLDLVRIDPDYRVVQVKQKFGGLRFYIEPSDESLQASLGDRIRQAELESFTVCELSGDPGELRTTSTGWVHVLSQRMYDIFNDSET